MPNDSLTQQLIEAITEFEQVRERARTIRNKLVQQYDWNSHEDVRTSVFEQFDNLIRSLSLSLALTLRGFGDHEWIHQLLFQTVNLSVEEETYENIRVRERLATFHRVGFLYALTQVVEGAIRSMLRALDFNDRATDGFGNVCIRLAHKMDQPAHLKEVRTALDLLREIRNTIHNNGVYWSADSSTSITIEYCGEKFIFYDGQPQGNAGFNVLWRITGDLISMFKILVEDRNIRNLSIVTGPTNTEPDAPQVHNQSNASDS